MQRGRTAQRLHPRPPGLEIYRAIDYDYEHSFGRADPSHGSHGVRSQLCDVRLREFLAEHPDGVIANLS